MKFGGEVEIGVFVYILCDGWGYLNSDQGLTEADRD
jgi:hypothetical protein